MREPSAPAPPAAAASSSSRLLPRTVLPGAGGPAHACPASLLGGSPASSPAGPRGPRGPRSPPERTLVLFLGGGERKTPVTGARRLGESRAAARMKATHRSGAVGRTLRSQFSPLSVLWCPHPSVGLTTSTATFSFSSKRPFRGAVTATPSSSAFFRSSSISWEHTSEVGVGVSAWLNSQSPVFLLSMAAAQASLLSSKQDCW